VFKNDLSELTDRQQQQGIFNRRAILSFFVVVLMSLGLLGRIAYLQILQHEKYQDLAQQNRVQQQPVAPPRGLLYDRKGRLIASNQPVKNLVLVKERIADMKATLNVLRTLVDLSDEEIERFEKRLEQRRRPFQGVTLRSKLSEQDVAAISVDSYRLPGVEIRAELARYYPYGDLFTHAIGYVGRLNEKELEKVDAKNYAATEYHGKLGVERFYEKDLHGQVGMREVEANASGRVMGVLTQQDPVPGIDLTLHLDVDIQKAAADALAGRRGSIVVMDVATGGVLAMVSTPSYDPNPFVTGISYSDYQALREDPQLPLYNRAIRGQYPPGSTIKPLLAMAGLEAGTVNWKKRQFDAGFFQLHSKGRRYRDWLRTGHGYVTLADGIVQSCDIVFYDLAVKTGIDRIAKFMDDFGFGRELGMDIWGDSPGILPSTRWKKSTRGGSWFPGETVIAGIGQGYWVTTPLQLAASTLPIATQGIWREPVMVKAGSGSFEQVDRPREFEIPVRNPANWKRTIKAMEDVMHGARGTARRVGAEARYRIAGKTGTVQVRSLGEEEEYDEATIEERFRDHALFVGFAPVDQPEVVISVVVENGGGGSSTAAPIAKQVLDAVMLDPMTGNVRVAQQ
jgi:penicillin-binding protein 2